MRILTIIVLCLPGSCLCSEFVAARSPGGVSASAAREPGQSFMRNLERIRRPVQYGPLAKVTRPPSVAESAVPYAGADALARGPDWGSADEVVRRFVLMRDARHLISADRPTFLRRATWLYPEDGCFARAGAAIAALRRLDPAAPTPAKIFIFGNLSVPSPYARVGRAYWWYHVAPVVSADGRGYVIDPAIEASRPLTVEEWISRQGARPESTQVVVCATGAYLPTDRCDGPAFVNEARAAADEGKYLNLEWTRLLELGRNPETELGERPPWR